MRYLYTFALYLLSPFIWLRLLWLARRNPAYLQRWHERIGYCPRIKPGSIWVHAVSVGETIAAVPLIQQLQTLYPERSIIITCTTPTGSERVKALFADSIIHSYFPYDFPGALRRFIRRVQPCLLLIMETELWPNLLHICRQQKIPVMLANARLSAKSASGYARFSTLTRQMLLKLTIVAAQHAADAQRFISLGLPAEHCHVTGSIKFDLTLPKDLNKQGERLRQRWDSKRPVWIAASTRSGEDEQILQAFQQIRLAIPDSLLVLVPRHSERAAATVKLSLSLGFNTVLRSLPQADLSATDVFIVDSTGELLLFYASADVAFVGGSLVPTGGHNPLEPAAVGIPVLFGPHTFNFASICEQLVLTGAAIRINSAQELAEHVLNLLQSAELRDSMRQKGQQMIVENQGALQRQLTLLKEILG